MNQNIIFHRRRYIVRIQHNTIFRWIPLYLSSFITTISMLLLEKLILEFSHNIFMFLGKIPSLFWYNHLRTEKIQLYYQLSFSFDQEI